jgi:hypothetical protein
MGEASERKMESRGEVLNSVNLMSIMGGEGQL